ncbi:FecCD family ABC transporter permease [Paenibacillus gansuensis]|uniref:FecCD family ABC transporter permease n=1 Tax=Paenibacillus gansuensis TaxID=306542 RepID=A0ABW5P8E6_9BACL
MLKKPSVLFVLLLAIIGVIFLSLSIGTIRVTPLEVLKSLAGMGSEQSRLILFDFRLPRIVLAMLIGAALALSGAVLQAVSGNDIADPGILGINAGAGFGVVLFLWAVQGNSYNELGSLSVLSMPISAIAGAMAASVLVYRLAWKGGITSTRLLLVGVAVHAAFSSALIIVQLKMDDGDFMRATIWLSGSIWGSNWTYVWAILPWIVLLIPYVVYKARMLDVLSLGDGLATGLGVPVERQRRRLLLASVALAGAGVAAGGGIAFIGLAAPHLAKRLVGPKHALLIPASALMGALLLLLADTIGKNILPPSEIPVGLVISIIGAPYFIYLLLRSKS